MRFGRAASRRRLGPDSPFQRAPLQFFIIEGHLVLARRHARAGRAVAIAVHPFARNSRSRAGPPSARAMAEALVRHLTEDSGRSDTRELVTGGTRGGRTPTLAECGTDLTALARDGLLDPVHGRDAELRACLRTLLRRRKNNVCLIGDPGVGST